MNETNSGDMRPSYSPSNAQTVFGCLACVIVIVFLGYSWLYPWVSEKLTGKKEQREKAAELMNKFTSCHELFSGYLKLMAQANDPNEKKSHLGTCKAAIEAIQPFRPKGVHPALSEVIAEYQLVTLQYIQAVHKYLNTMNADNHTIDTLTAEISTLAEKYDAIYLKVKTTFNRIAIELGGIDGGTG
jgi:DNA repair ATPase RecN